MTTYENAPPAPDAADADAGVEQTDEDDDAAQTYRREEELGEADPATP